MDEKLKKIEDLFSIDPKDISKDIPFHQSRIKTEFDLIFKTTYEKLNELYNLWIRLDDKKESQINNTLINWFNVLATINDNLNKARLIQTNADQIRSTTNLYNDLKNFYQDVFTPQKGISDYYNVYSFLSTEFNSKNIYDLINKYQLTKIDQHFNELKQNFETTETKSENILKKLEAESGKKVIYDYAAEYNTLSTRQKKDSNKWLILGAISILFLFTIIILFAKNRILPVPGNLNFPDNLEYIISKLLIVAVIIFIMSFAFKQYNICRNISAIYMDKAKALDSYKLMLQSFSNNENLPREQITVELAKSIYSTINTGYISDGGNQKMSSGIVELTKNIINQSPVN